MTIIEKRYQVFVSSTYTDLIEERSEVMQALLELDCMPAGMEIFPAANDDQWTWIKKVIDDSDYYIVVAGGRYGSVSDSTGLSYTEMEYQYAIERGRPIIGFLHEDPSTIPAKDCEQDPESREKLTAFRKLVQSRLCKFWSSPADLGAKVSRSVTQLIKQYPAVGWVRANQLSAHHNPEEVLKLHERIRELEGQLEDYVHKDVEEIRSLAGGKDKYQLRFSFNLKQKVEVDGRSLWRTARKEVADVWVSWDDIFSYLAPSLVGGVTQYALDQELNSLARHYGLLGYTERYPNDRLDNFSLSADCKRAILVQLRALLLIENYDRSSWRLSSYGDEYMTRSLAIKKGTTEP